MYTLRKVNRYADYENETIGNFETLIEVREAFIREHGNIYTAMATRYVLIEDGKLIDPDYR